MGYYASAYQIRDLSLCGSHEYMNSPFYVDAIEIIKELSGYEVEIPEGTTAADYFEAVLDMFDIDAYDVMDNSYNWNGAVTHHFDFRAVEDFGNACFVLVKWHKYGDVRANYTCCALYRFYKIEDFYYAIDEVRRQKKVIIDDKIFWVEPDPFSEYRVIFYGNTVKEMVVEDMDDLKREIKEGLGN